MRMATLAAMRPDIDPAAARHLADARASITEATIALALAGLADGDVADALPDIAADLDSARQRINALRRPGDA